MGAAVRVYTHPGKPQLCVLEPGPTPAIRMRLKAAAVCLVLAAVGFALRA